MLIAIISDIHSNLHALDAVFKDADSHSPDKYYCLGDIVGYGAFPVECVKLVRERCEHVIFGNHEYALLYPNHAGTFNRDANKALEYTRKKLSVDDINWMFTLEPHLVLDGITLAHGSLRDFEEYVSDATIARLSLEIQETKLLVIGHTHYPEGYQYDLETKSARAIDMSDKSEYCLSDGYRYLVNVGSVGQPRDGDSRAGYCLYDSEKLTVKIIRVEYDIKSAVEAIKTANLPEFLAKRLFAGR